MARCNQICGVLGVVAGVLACAGAAQAADAWLTGQAAINYAVAHGWPVRATNRNGDSIVLSCIEYGRPMYIGAGNANAAVTIGIVQDVRTRAQIINIRPGLSFSTRVPFLMGSGAPTVGVWDVGAVRTSHAEFGGRVLQVDRPSALSNHATHVTGTIAATGVNPMAIGMAPLARFRAFDVGADLPEMAVEAARGMQFSNHSYGYRSGWMTFDTDVPGLAAGSPVWLGQPWLSTTEDAFFGLYEFQCSAWDALAYQFPGYLPVVAAGNERNDGPPMGGAPHFELGVTGWVPTTVARPKDGGASGFDTITGHALAKNVLTVGAVDDRTVTARGGGQVRVIDIAPFSSAGPADDGRIKPDVVAKGVALLSTGSSGDSAYSTLSGTSMATPCVTGGLMLLSERERMANVRLDGSTTSEHFTRSATYKALLIHTATDLGNRGPDYIHGWGLVNVQKAVAMIEEDASSRPTAIQELTAFPLQAWTMYTRAPITGAVKVTICWTDPAAAALPLAVDSPTPVLVNDLDLRVEEVLDSNPEGAAIAINMPWRLSRTSPELPATTGDNTVDNVEQVEFIAGGGKIYRITVKTKQFRPLVGGRQDFSVLISGLTPATTQGACCAPTGNCEVKTKFLCGLFAFRGAGTTCQPNPCPQPPALGACCTGAACVLTPQTLCPAQTSVYRGTGTVCGPTACLGACCQRLGGCVMVLPGTCIGTFRGIGQTCGPNGSCP